MEQTQEKKSYALLGIIIGASLILSTCIGAYTVYRLKGLENTVSVTGSAKKAVTSDQVKWVSDITRTVKVSQLKSGYTQIANDLLVVNTFMKENGIPESEIVISPVIMNQNYDYRPDSQAEKEYVLMQTITVNSKDIPKITGLAKNIQSIIDKGVIFSTQAVEYYYSKLPEERVALLSEALTDAKSRAQALGDSTGKKVGTLTSASSGVVQVLSANSVEVSDYGAYDTSKIEKEIMVTVKAAFTLR